jgi:hypothetical protein
MGQPQVATVELHEVNCGECGGTYAINARYHQHKREKGGYWTCPYCKTGWGFGESQIDKITKERDAEKARHQATLARLNEANAERDKAQKAAARLKKRASAGLCTCCNRHFTNLERHMQTKHKDKT